eukprot:1158680-Pelagomonas_calceolata.AAC.3
MIFGGCCACLRRLCCGLFGDSGAEGEAGCPGVRCTRILWGSCVRSSPKHAHTNPPPLAAATVLPIALVLLRCVCSVRACCQQRGSVLRCVKCGGCNPSIHSKGVFPKSALPTRAAAPGLLTTARPPFNPITWHLLSPLRRSTLASHHCCPNAPGPHCIAA